MLDREAFVELALCGDSKIAFWLQVFDVSPRI